MNYAVETKIGLAAFKLWFQFQLAPLHLGNTLQSGAAPDYSAVAGWYRRAADAGVAKAAYNLANMHLVGRGWACQMLSATSSSTL